jgi:hypothetical protein
MASPQLVAGASYPLIGKDSYLGIRRADQLLSVSIDHPIVVVKICCIVPK